RSATRAVRNRAYRVPETARAHRLRPRSRRRLNQLHLLPCHPEAGAFSPRKAPALLASTEVGVGKKHFCRHRDALRSAKTTTLTDYQRLATTRSHLGSLFPCL